MMTVSEEIEGRAVLIQMRIPRRSITAIDFRRLVSVLRLVETYDADCKAALEEGERTNSTVPFCRVVGRLERASRAAAAGDVEALDEALDEALAEKVSEPDAP